MNARLRSLALGKSKRKSSGNITPQPTSSPPLNGVIHTPTGSNTSTTSLPMNQSPAQNGLGRPPSYTYNPNAPRATSPMPPGQQQAVHHPPPINTNPYSLGHPAAGGAPQLPPVYGAGYQQPNGMGGGGAPGPGIGQYGSRAAPVEVEGAGKSKAQLIVGIDFVSVSPPDATMLSLIYLTGHDLLRRRFCVCNQHGSKGGHNHGMARRGKSDKTEGMTTTEIYSP